MRTRHFPGSGLLFGFGSQGVDDYAAMKPVLDLRDYLDGPLTASGVFFGLSGRVRRHFTMEMAGHWSGAKGVIDEKYRYDNGETGERRWELEFRDDRTFTGTARDVEGTVTGAQCGNAAAMRYRLRVPGAKGGIVVAMEDWFHLMDDGTLMNRARMSRFGFKVGEVFASFRKRGAAYVSAGPVASP